MIPVAAAADSAAVDDLADVQAMEQTLARLVLDGDISESRAAALQACLPREIRRGRYILKNLAAHLSIGVVFAFDVVPLPLGTLARVGWVAGARVTETLKRNPERARIHSLGVFAIAAIPWFGYAAYLLPLRRQSAELGFVLANHSWLKRTGKSYERFVSTASAPVARFARWLVPLPGKAPD